MKNYFWETLRNWNIVEDINNLPWNWARKLQATTWELISHSLPSSAAVSSAAVFVCTSLWQFLNSSNSSWKSFVHSFHKRNLILVYNVYAKTTTWKFCLQSVQDTRPAFQIFAVLCPQYKSPLLINEHLLYLINFLKVDTNFVIFFFGWGGKATKMCCCHFFEDVLCICKVKILIKTGKWNHKMLWTSKVDNAVPLMLDLFKCLN